MIDSILDKWLSLSGRIGRKEYWLVYMLPAGVFLLSSRLGLPFTGWAALWFFTLGNVKRVRDFKVSGVAVMGIWWTVMVIAMVIGAGLFLFAAVGGMLYGLTFGWLDIGVAGRLGETWLTAAVIFFTPIGILLLVAGFVPGLDAKQSGDLPSSGTDTDNYALDSAVSHQALSKSGDLPSSAADSDSLAPDSADSPKSMSNGMKVAVVGGVVLLIVVFQSLTFMDKFQVLARFVVVGPIATGIYFLVSRFAPKSLGKGLNLALLGGVVFLIFGSLGGEGIRAVQERLAISSSGRLTVRDGSGDVLIITLEGDGARTPDRESATPEPTLATTPPVQPPPPAARPAAPTVGLFTINTTPFGTVAIDGVEIGDTPIVRHELPPGQYIVTVSRAGFQTIVDTLDVTAGNDYRWQKTLVRRNE